MMAATDRTSVIITFSYKALIQNLTLTLILELTRTDIQHLALLFSFKEIRHLHIQTHQPN